MASSSEWKAISNNDAEFDGVFWYGVKTTHIFCRPSCPSRLPKRENISIYYDPKLAEADGFRPCKRCRPLNSIVSNETWVQEIDEFLNNHYSENITLSSLSSQIHGSESYLRHVYKQLTGVTPQQKLMNIRLEYAKSLLKNTNDSIKSVGMSVGIDNTTYFIQCFKRRFEITPKQFQYQSRL
ncbi:bifunctional transcriptional activator/DNA repair enzyme AdaA [Companilactobacillus ginsenosidimutans]|uniref:Methylphosphotriester-DNA alkyltransferase n=1 Tax=Companilactobacillus ginsenosidimutans TaxID=1007676 RepID=A0A0H4R1F3_9LACO|nr:Ada metal-binding domain-containing protein [Companilactobacillus ginsenosidimutans]AKP67555.1 methylphosphotriester-DNA alkyltransferase [Companilactobacillus ginsenosidimutans]